MKLFLLFVVWFKDNLIGIYKTQLIAGHLFGIFLCLCIGFIVLNLSLLLIQLFLFLLKL